MCVCVCVCLCSWGCVNILCVFPYSKYVGRSKRGGPIKESKRINSFRVYARLPTTNGIPGTNADEVTGPVNKIFHAGPAGYEDFLWKREKVGASFSHPEWFGIHLFLLFPFFPSLFLHFESFLIDPNFMGKSYIIILFAVVSVPDKSLNFSRYALEFYVIFPFILFPSSFGNWLKITLITVD